MNSYPSAPEQLLQMHGGSHIRLRYLPAGLSASSRIIRAVWRGRAQRERAFTRTAHTFFFLFDFRDRVVL